MINYTEKGQMMFKAITDAGHYLYQRDNVWISTDDGAVQAIIDTYPLSAYQHEICAAIDSHAYELRGKATSGVSPAEMSGWSLKLAEARAYQQTGNPLDAAPLLTIEASIRGIQLSDIVTRVLQNAQSLATLEATIAGVSGKHKDAVKSCVSFAEVALYDWRAGWPNV